MKKYIYILLSVCSLLSFTACNDDFLNLNPKDQLSEQTFWADQTDAFNALVGVYSRYTDYENVNIYYDQLLGLSARSDEAVNVWKGSNYNNLGAGTISPFDDYIYTQWAIRYRIIRACNVFLKNIERPVMNEDERARMTAEVKFLRAFAYQYLLNNYGGVPIVKEPLTLEDLKLPRNTAEEVQNFILEDLSDKVIDVLPLTYSNEYKGRISRGAAYALKARVYLYAGKWKEASVAAQKVIDFKAYSLYPSYEDLFESANKYNDEILYSWQYVGLKMANYTQIYLHFPTYGGWGGINPIQSFVDEFLCSDGKPSSTSSVYISSKPYEKRDPRFYMSIIYPGATYRGKVIPIYGTIDYPGETGNSSQTGYYVSKFLDNISESNKLRQEESNVILIRYAEVLLTYAEGKIEANEIDQSVYDALNALRARAYGVNISETSKYPAVLGGTQSELRDIVRGERMVELCFEGQRRDDIIRWRIADNVMNRKCYGIPATIGGENILVMERKFDPTKDYLLPIPQKEIDLVGKDILFQNPGWE